jgi:hypothetical protein
MNASAYRYVYLMTGSGLAFVDYVDVDLEALSPKSAIDVAKVLAAR